jgi:hypothetical protein
MKSTWEEKVPQGSSPPSEVDILKALVNAKIRGLPQVYDLDSAVVTDDNNVEVETHPLPSGHHSVALTEAMRASLKPLMSHYLSSNTSKSAAPEEMFPRLKIQKLRKDFNAPLSVRRRLVRIFMSSCSSLKVAMRNAGPKLLMETIRDSMIVYYDCYKSPPNGFLHGGKYLQI